MNEKDLIKGVKPAESPVNPKENLSEEKDQILKEIAVIEDEGLGLGEELEHLDKEETAVNPNELTAVLKRELKVDTTDKEIIEKKKREFKGTASTILLALLIITAILSWFLTGESYDIDDNLVTVEDKGRYGLFDIIRFLEEGFIRDIGGIWFLVIASGAMGVFIRTGAPQAMMQRMKKSHFFTPTRTLIFVMTIISIVTTTFNANYLLVAVSVFVVPLLVFNGYDIITALMAMLFASAAGQMSSIFNAELIGQWIEVMNGSFNEAGGEIAAIADGLVFRTITFVLFTTSAIVIVWNYGDKVLNDFDSSESRRETSKFIQSSSVIFGNAGKAEFTTKRKIIMGAFTLMIVISLIGIIQWDQFGINFFYDLSKDWNDKDHFMRFIWGNLMKPLGRWSYLEVSYLFLLFSLFCAFMAAIPQRKYIQGMTRGINTALNIVLILTLSGALYEMLKHSGLHYTIFYNTLDFFANTFGDAGVPIGSFFSSIIFSGAFPITQDLMSIIADVMPRIIIDMSGPSFEYVMFIGSTITMGAGLISIILPTSAITVGLIWAFKIPYNKWVKAVWKPVAIYALVTIPMIVAFTLLLV